MASLAGIWRADGIVLLMSPRYIIAQVREILQQSPGLLRWELLAIFGGALLLVAANDLPYRWLWMVTAGGMIAKGAFLSIGPSSCRTPVIEWCLGREDIDYRFWGLSLCMLAVLLFHALGWIGRN
ncbi:MAG: hypothetical protein WBK08_01650 [Nitrospira sp.]